MNNKELPPYDASFSNLCNINPLQKNYNNFENLTTSDLSSEQALCRFQLYKIAPTGDENDASLWSMWVRDGMKSFKEFLMWYNNKDVVPTVEAKQKLIENYHQREIDILKLGCTLPNLAIICRYKSTHSKFYPFTESDKDLLEKIREDIVGGPSIAFAGKAVIDETFIRKSTTLCESIVGINASQLYPYSMCQALPTGLYTRWNYDSESQKSMPRQNKTGSSQSMVFSYFQQTRPECQIESNVKLGRQKQDGCFSADGFCNHCNTVFELMGCFFHYRPCPEARPPLTDNKIIRGIKKGTRPIAQRIYRTEKIQN